VVPVERIDWHSSDGASQGGHQVDNLFYNVGGSRFDDLSGLSGLDHDGDGRSMALLDFDRDGRTDIAVVYADHPLLNLFHNRSHLAGAGRENRSVALRFEGGNAADAPSADWAPRSGCGARVTLDLGDATLIREQHCGEGLAAQNSATMIVGIGPREQVGEVVVRWPSGREERVGPVAAGCEVQAYERAEASATGQAMVVRPYLDGATDCGPVP
jgi:hypothetical protein